MPIVQSFGALRAMTTAPTWTMPPSTSLDLYGRRYAYAEIYRCQPNVRTCVDFLARNIGELTCHWYRRKSDTDRERLVDHDCARWLGKPNPSTSRYRLQESMVADLALYFNAYWLKARYLDASGQPAIGLVRLPPAEMSVVGGLLPRHYLWTAPNGERQTLPLSEVVYFNGYNPINPLMGLSPLDTLHRILAEEAAAGEHREGFWRNSARVDGIVTRPATKPRYNETQLQSWREQWQREHAGGLGAGRTLLLQDGETFTPAGWSAKDSEYLSARKLSREECAAAWHIPLPLVGILEHATFSNIKEQHKHLYQDCLGPWLRMIVEEFHRQLLVESADQTDVYAEFNIAQKLAGSFEEQAASIQQAVGRPWMTANEARALQNLPRIDDDDADALAAQQGGPSAIGFPTPAGAPRADAADTVLAVTRGRQLARLDKLPRAERAIRFYADMPRFNRELARDLAAHCNADDARRRAEIANGQLLAELMASEGHAA
jgi:HK97 family phage portal protein